MSGAEGPRGSLEFGRHAEAGGSFPKVGLGSWVEAEGDLGIEDRPHESISSPEPRC